MDHYQAEIIALNILKWMGEDSEIMGRFFNQTGLSLEILKETANEPELLAAVLDFFLSLGDRMISSCCESLNMSTGLPLKARMALPGREVYHWT